METNKDRAAAGKPRMKRKAMYLWVWENVLTEWYPGVAFACAETEAKAWDVLKATDEAAWRELRGNLAIDENDRRTPRQLAKDRSVVRPIKVTSRYAYTCRGSC